MNTRTWIVIGMVSILFAACEKRVETRQIPTPQPGPNQTWIDAPLPDSKLPLQPYNLVFHGASFVGVTEFEIKINGAAEAVVQPFSSGSGGSQYGTLFMGEYLWDPQAPGTYLIQVRAKGNGAFSSPASVTVTIPGAGLEPANQEPGGEEDQECTYTALINQYCRRGPSKYFEAVDNFVPEQIASIVGQSTDGYFWYVIGPNYGELCTVPTEDGFGETSGNCDTLPRFTPMPIPTPTMTPEPTDCPAGVSCP